MKIAIVSAFSRLGGKTGDVVQADQTVHAMRGLGHDVLRCYLKAESGELHDEAQRLIGKWSDVLDNYDVVHVMPPIPYKQISHLPKLSAKLACSTVFWRSKAFTRVCQVNKHGKIGVFELKDYLRTFLAWLGLPNHTAYSGYDLLLPNSEDEIRCVRRFCRVKRGARIVAVPNAVDSIPGHVATLKRLDFVPTDDYIVVPAFFADRKNQISLIRALRDAPYPVVFAGEGPRLEECKKVANAHMTFLGHVAHGSDEFYALLKYARVVCLPSNCETPGIAGLEGAALGARPVVPYEGGTCQYYGWDAEYLDPLSLASIRDAVDVAWRRGRLSAEEMEKYRQLTWEVCAQKTVEAYQKS